MSVLTEWEMCCPKCKRDDCLEVEMTCWGKLSVDGTEAESDNEWSGESKCRCSAEGCEWTGTVDDTHKAADVICAAQSDEDPDYDDDGNLRAGVDNETA